MKRIGYLYEKIYAMDNLKLAHKNAQKGKTWYRDVQEINKDEESYLIRLQNSIKNQTYDTSKYEVFKKQEGGKVREIYKLPYYPDRVCQWAILQIIEPYLMKHMTKDTYSAIPGRGIHLGLKRLKQCVRRDPEETWYCLKLDVRKYYPSINHDVLKNILRGIFKDEKLLWLLFEIIDSTPGNKGIPIGNYMSQWYGNIYLSNFDHWVKEHLRVKYYFRYMDDIVIFSSSKERLHEILKEIDNYFKNKLDIEIKKNYQIFPTKVRGVDFLGYRVFPKFTLLRKSTLKQLKRKIISVWRTLNMQSLMTRHQWCSINSYRGWLIHCDSYRLSRKYILPLEEHIDRFYKEVIKNGNVQGCS